MTIVDHKESQAECKEFINKTFGNLKGTYRSCKFTKCSFSAGRVDGVFIECDFVNIKFNTITLKSRFIRCSFTNCVLLWSKIEKGTVFTGCDLRGLRELHSPTIMNASIYGGKSPTGACGKHLSRKIGFRIGDRKPPNHNVQRVGTSPHTGGNSSNCSTSSHGLGSPITLPEVEHYRSKPAEMPKYAVEKVAAFLAGKNNDKPYEYTFKNAWGFLDNAVIECSDIKYLMEI